MSEKISDTGERRANIPNLEPSPEELERLSGPPLAVPGQVLAKATLASSAELARMQPRAPKRSLPWGGVLAAGVVLFALLLPQGPGPMLLAQEAPTTLDGNLKMGLNMKVEGQAVLVLHEYSRQGTEVELMSGQATFDVDPAGEYTQLRVSYGDWVVYTQGGRFTLSDLPALSVESGSVVLKGPEMETALGPKDRWSPVPETASLDRVVQTEPLKDLLPVEVKATLRKPKTEVLPETNPAAEQPAPAVMQDPAEQAAFEALLLARAERSEQTGTLAEQFLVEWTDSALQAEVQAIAIAAQLADPTLDPVRTLSKVDAWLTSNPQHPRFVEMHYLRATLLRDQLHDCQRAVPSYRVVVQLGAGTQRAQAEHYLQACLAGQ